MRLVGRIATAETPWYWALNGVFGLLSSAVAVLVSIEFGISTTLYLGSLCYALTALALWRIGLVGVGARAVPDGSGVPALPLT